MESLSSGNSKKRFVSLQFQLLFTPIICVLIGILAIALLSSYLVRESMFTEMKNRGVEAARRYIEQMEEYTDNLYLIKTDQKMLASSENEALTRAFSIQKMAEKLVDQDEIVYVTVIDKNAVAVADGVPEDVGIDYSEDLNMKRATQEKNAWASEFYHADMDLTVYEVIEPVIMDGEQMGAIVIGYSMENVYSTVTQITLVVGGVGIIIFLLLTAVLYRISTVIISPIHKVKQMAVAMCEGDLSNRLKLEANNEIGEVAWALDSFSDMLETEIIATLNQVAVGDLSANLEVKGERDQITPSLKATIKNIRSLITEANRLFDAVANGNLKLRGKTDEFQGGYQQAVQGVNDTLDAVVKPLYVAVDYINCIGHGEIPPKITETCYGDFNTIKNNMNACIDGLGTLEKGNDILARMRVNDYTQSIGGSSCGIYAEMSDSINIMNKKIRDVTNIINRIAEGDMSDLENLITMGKRSDEDRLVPSLIGMIENIVALVKETEDMTRIAIEGDLNHRGDVTKFKGEYAKVINGFNETIAAIIVPIQAASATLNQLSQGNLKVQVVGDFRGDHGKIKEDMNQNIDFLKNYVEEISGTLKKIGQGDLSQEISTYFTGDFIDIKNSINSITTHLSMVMGKINESATQVELGSWQIFDGGQQLSQGSTEQANAIEELLVSIDEIATETKRTAKNADQANKQAVEVCVNAQAGNEHMTKVVESMAEINVSSHKTAKVIKESNSIASQINILALNAAIEAARAGRHGKGFAIVAEEAGILAVRSAEAARETAMLIEESIKRVEAVAEAVDDTAASLNGIYGKIEWVTQLVGRIARASNKQATEISQICMCLDQVLQVVQSNAVTAEQSAAASQELSSQAELLHQMVGSFKIKKGRIGSNATKQDSKNLRGGETNYLEDQRRIIPDDCRKQMDNSRLR